MASEMVIVTSDTFRSWGDVDGIIKAYGKRHEFTIIKKRLGQREDGSIKHRSFRCEFGGRYHPQKQVDINSHRDRKSKCQQCPWNANFNCPQNSQGVSLTTFNNLHNYALFPADTENYSSKYRCIPDDVLKEVQFLTEHRNLPITTQQKLLKAKFLTISILDCDLSNVIHDAFRLLKILIEHKSNDPRWFIDFQLDQDKRLTQLFWMSMSQITLCHNNIIKRELSANSTLCGLADALDARFEHEAQWNQFFEYRILSTYVGIITVSQDLFPKVDKIMTEYLTPQILSAERMEMAQCLYFVPSQVEPNIVEDPEAGVMEGCVEDSYDAKQILLKSIIAEVGEENIQEVWKITDMRPENKKHIYFVKDKDVAAKTCCFVNTKAAQNFSGVVFTPNPSTVPTTITNHQQVLNRRIKC
ncbi:unnamed protein product [Rhizophagus irregularis]|nr:unnamed protein product [Rhizophagus irregularis]